MLLGETPQPDKPASGPAASSSVGTQDLAKDILLDEGDIQCAAKKKIVVDLGLSGLGNRMLALVSSALLAIAMDRQLEIEWPSNKLCGFGLKELFVPKDTSQFLPRPFIFETEFGKEYKHMGSGMLITCTTRLDQFDYDALYFVKDKQLFDRLNNRCDLIYIKTNLYFVSALYDQNLMGEPAMLLKSQFPHPFKDIASIIYKATPDVTSMGDNFIKDKLQGKKWLSFHGRQFADGGKEYMDTFVCISKLLQEGQIDAVFVTAESSKLTDLAYETIPDKDKIFSMERNNVHKPPTLPDARTAEMQVAMLQWYMMYKAPYCITNTVKASTFALTAMVSGDCQFLMLEPGGVCSLTKTLEDKELLMASTPKLRAMPGLTADRREKIWSTVVIANKLVSNYECFKKSRTGNIRAITPYWVK